MSEPRRLHGAAVLVYSASALRNFAFPLLVIVGATLLGGEFDARGLLRALTYGGIGLAAAVVMGMIRWQTTTYTIDTEAIHHHTGFLSTKDTDVRLDRIQAIDVQQGPLQRLFGVFAVDVQTGAGAKGGEISLPALTPAAVEELRAARPGAVHDVAREESEGRRLTGRELAVAALTAGQLGIVLPVLAGGFQIVSELFDPESGEEAVRWLPQSASTIALVALALVVVAWLLSAAGAVIAFGGFTVVRDGDRLRIRRGLVQRSEATVPVDRIRAVRVVEGVFRRPFGLAALTVEVIGYAEEASAARTLFPLVRMRDVEAFLDEFLPELADDPVPSGRPPARAARRYFVWPLAIGAAFTAAAWFFVGPVALVLLALSALYARAHWRAAAWRLRDGRLAVRSLVVARTTVLAPARFRESHTLLQNLFQRRAGLADLSVAFGKSTTARIRHLEARDAQEAWAAL